VRALAAGLVLLNHIQLLTGRPTSLFGVAPGPLGVVIFFLVSGFLIERSARGFHGDLRDFLIERASRIYVCFVPALTFTMLLVSSLLGRADRPGQPGFLGELHTGVWQFAGNLLMLQGYPAFQLARRAGLDMPWFVHPYTLAEPYWAIPIELFLYLSFGVLYFVLVRRAAKLTAPVMLALAVAGLPAIYHACTGWGECLSLVWLLGALGSRWFHAAADAEPQRALRTRAIIVVIAAAAVLLGLRLLSRGGNFYDLQKALFLGVILLGGLELAGRTHWLELGLVRAPAAYFAKTSYALYLTHNAIIGWTVMHYGEDLSALQLAAAFLACQLCAFLFWWMFDRHHKRVAVWLREAALPRPTSAGVPQS
jgi:peptidoglycan/LPS O-acetylase OafA/YrhL